MPTSAPYCVPVIASIARQVRPRSVLEIGVGFGKYGFLFREFLDIWDAVNLHEYQRSNWKTRIEGIEATRAYLTPVHEFLYDKIHVGDASTLIDRVGRFDLVIACDVLEHFEKDAGMRLLDKMYGHASRCVVLTFPEDCEPRFDVRGNDYEAHRSRWTRQDFQRFPQVRYRLFEDRAALCVLTKPPNIAPQLTPSFAGRVRRGWKGVASRALVSTIGAKRGSRFASLLLRRPITLQG